MASFRGLYQANAPIKETIAAYAILYSDHDSVAQDDFAHQISLVDSHPTFKPSTQYTLLLLQAYVKHIERTKACIESDSLTELLFETTNANRSLTLTLDREEYSCYLSFTNELLLQGTIGIRVCPRHNDVGLRCWEAGCFLAEYFIANPLLIKGKRVLELGAGVGLTSIVCSGVCKAEQVHMTDYTDVTIANMKHNCMANQKWLEDQGVGDVDRALTVGFLDWVAFVEEENGGTACQGSMDKFIEADVLIAADCVYDVNFIPHLVLAVERLLGLGKGKVAYFATTFRNEKTFGLFIESLQSQKIKYTEINFKDFGKFKVFPTLHVPGREEIKIHMFSS